MSIPFNDNIEVRKAADIDTRGDAATFNDLTGFNTTYNYIGMEVRVLDVFKKYQLQSGTGALPGDWSLVKTLLEDESSPKLTAALDANSQNITNAGSIQGYRPIKAETGAIVIGATHQNKFLSFTITGNSLITVDNSSSAAVVIGTEVEIFHGVGAFEITFIGTGDQSIISKDDNLKLNGVGTAAVLKLVATNTWALIGDLIS